MVIKCDWSNSPLFITLLSLNRSAKTSGMAHPMRVSNESRTSPLPGFSDSVHKIIETAIENNDLDFFYRLYLTRIAELSLTGQGKEFIEYAKSSLDESQNSLFMAKGFEAIGNLIDLNFSLKINGELKQQGNTGNMLFSIDAIIEYVSQFFTVKIGDLIFTGTPAGVGPVKIGDRLIGFLKGSEMFNFEIK